MQAGHPEHDSEVREGLGHSGLHLERAREGGQSLDHAYQVLRFNGCPKQYLAYICARWKRSLRYGNHYFRLIKPEAFYAAYDIHLANLLPEATCRVAVLSEDHDVCLGFSVSRGEVLDYVHVHKDFRGKGIGRKLVPDGITTISNLTKSVLPIWGNKCPRWEFNPYA